MSAKVAVEHRPVNRRNFLRQTTTAAAVAAIPLAASSYARVPGSLERIRIGFLGCGGRAQAHLHLITKLASETRTVMPAAVCDVWDGHEDEYDQQVGTTVSRRRYAQGLYPAARKCGLDPVDRTHVVKDYRRVLDLKDVDAVCIATPDHWHARMALDAITAGKDLFIESPMTRTSLEAHRVVEALSGTRRVATVAIPTLANPAWSTARELIQQGRIGPVVHLSASVFRTDPRGMWRFYRTVPSMTPNTIDWDLFLGHRFEVGGVPLGPSSAECPFDRATFTQWRCDARFSGGPFTDFFTTPVTRLLAAAGLGSPKRVTGTGGLVHERDGRDVPDVATITAEFAGGCQLVVTGSTAAMGSGPEDMIRGPGGAIRFVSGGVEVHDKQGIERIAVEAPKNETEALWTNFLDCIRRRDPDTVSLAGLGAAAVNVIASARESSRTGQSIGLTASTS